MRRILWFWVVPALLLLLAGVLLWRDELPLAMGLAACAFTVLVGTVVQYRLEKYALNFTLGVCVLAGTYLLYYTIVGS